jgi:hypothetical protein
MAISASESRYPRHEYWTVACFYYFFCCCCRRRNSVRSRFNLACIIIGNGSHFKVRFRDDLSKAEWLEYDDFLGFSLQIQDLYLP